MGCEVTAADINPVAWFILKCTLEYPQRMAGKTLPLPAFALQSAEFMSDYLQAQGIKKSAIPAKLAKLGITHTGKSERSIPQLTFEATIEDEVAPADLAWHVRAWGWWVLQQAKQDLERFYPVVDNKPTVAYLWARTVICHNCRAIIPLLKTRWLRKKDKKRTVLTMEPNADRTGVVFGILNNPEVSVGNTIQKNELDNKQAGGTMSRSGVSCPCCQAIMRMEELRAEGKAGRLGATMTAVVVDGIGNKEYRLPTEAELLAAQVATQDVDAVFAEIPFGLPEENVPKGGNGASRAFSVDGYGLDRWYKLFTPRQLVTLGTFVKHTRAVCATMREEGYEQDWIEVINGYLALTIDRMADRGSSICSWDIGRLTIRNTFSGFRLPMNWDFVEAIPVGERTGSYSGQIELVAEYIEHALSGCETSPYPSILSQSAIKNNNSDLDIIITDPPYYDAIPYSDLMDFFYVWLRRSLYGLSEEIDHVFSHTLSPKWDHESNDGELIDDSSRFQGSNLASKKNYEDGMYRSFQSCYQALAPNGRIVIVFAHKQPDAWETLVSAVIRAGFVVDGSWPIQTEMGNRTRAISSAALSSSVWLVCKKRSKTARPGWDQAILAEMREKIKAQLRSFWDAGIRGPDFVWAATGPAMEAYSKYPVVKKADQPDEVMKVTEFLRHVRRLVLDFVVGRVLMRDGDETTVSGLDDVTTYYLLHRHDFHMESVPIGPCILYAMSCELKDNDLLDRYDILARSGGQQPVDAVEDGAAVDEADESMEPEAGTKSKVRLKTWEQRKRLEMGYSSLSGKPIPMIDQIHRLLHLWAERDQSKVDDYIGTYGLGQNALFVQVLQAVIELAVEGSDERALLENISNHLNGHRSSEKRGSLQQKNLFA